MSRAWTFVGIGLVILVSIWMQRVAIEIIGPNSQMYANIASVTWPVDGDQWADQMYVIVAVWVPWIIRIGAIAGGIYREFTGQNVTAARVGAGGPPR